MGEDKNKDGNSENQGRLEPEDEHQIDVSKFAQNNDADIKSGGAGDEVKNPENNIGDDDLDLPEDINKKPLTNQKDISDASPSEAATDENSVQSLFQTEAEREPRENVAGQTSSSINTTESDSAAEPILQEAQIKYLKTKNVYKFLIVYLLLVYGYFYQSGFLDEQARFDMVRSIAMHKQLYSLSPLNATEYVVFEKKHYCVKPPGGIFLGVIPFWVGFHFSNLFDLAQQVKWSINLHIATVFSVSLISAFGACAVYSIAAFMAKSSAIGLLLTFIYSLATLIFPYSTLFYGNVISGALLIISFAIIFFEAHKEQKRPLSGFGEIMKIIISGVCGGYAVTAEYPTLLIAGIIGLYVLLSYKKLSLRHIVLWGFGFLLGFGVIFWYNNHIFHNPLKTGYSLYGNPENQVNLEQTKGFLGISKTDFNILYAITLSTYKGLFYYNPVLLLAPISALIGWFLNRRFRLEIVISFLIVVIFLIFNASYGTSTILFWGGNSCGPRRIVPMIPFLVVLLAVGCRYLIWLIIPLGMLSFVNMTFCTAIHPYYDCNLQRPFKNYLFKYYLMGRYAIHNYGMFSNDPVTEDSMAWNIAKLLKVKGMYQLIPALLIIWAGVFFKIRKTFLYCKGRVGFINYFLLSLWTILMLVFMFYPIFKKQMKYRMGMNKEGFQAAIYDNPNFWGEPFSMAVVDDINFDQSFIYDNKLVPKGVFNFAVRITGNLIIKESGNYEFFTSSDDGSRLYIDKLIVVENWGDHGAQKKFGMKFLSEGAHPFELMYYNKYVYGGLQAKYRRIAGQASAAEDWKSFKDLLK